MKLFKKVKYPNGRRHIYLFGVKIFSYYRPNKTQEHTVIINNNMANIIAQNIHMHDGYNTFEYEYLKHYFQNKEIVKIEKDTLTWLETISILISEKNFIKAISLLNIYINNFGYKDIDLYENICELLRKINKNTPITDNALNKYRIIHDIQSQQKFEKLVKKAKKIAVVGRSPILCGQKKGKEIDSHDLIIRFNNASVSEEYIKDFGKKTNIMIINCKQKNNDDLFYLYKDIRTFGFFRNVIDEIDLSDCKNIDFLPKGLKYEIFTESEIDEPTSGMIVIYWLNKILGNLNKVDFYGFAFQDNNMNLSHYDANHVINTDIHDMTTEILYLKDFINKNKKEYKL